MKIPEAKEFENIDLVSSLFGEIVDVHSGSFGGTPITNVFTRYIDIIQTINKQSDSLDWTEHELLEL